MSAIKAKNNYIGVNGSRMNCAQAVLSAFQEKYNIEDNLVEAFQKYGGGKAPEGLCGAYYAVKYILSNYDKEKVADLEQYFLENAGALECSNIKGLKKLSCVGCVEKSSEFLEKLG
ncbi:MAG TPA: C-GCAxxG-C-C family (seleno)protein [Ruminiclostridium sp.]|nr:C-GCAxxG-C-C family (seleno)protein [Ruminiclostridium sp.]